MSRENAKLSEKSGSNDYIDAESGSCIYTKRKRGRNKGLYAVLASFEVFKLGFVVGSHTSRDRHELFADYINDTVSLREVVLFKLERGCDPVA